MTRIAKLRLGTPHVDDYVKTGTKLLSIAGRSLKWYNHCETQFSSFSLIVSLLNFKTHYKARIITTMWYSSRINKT